MSPSRRALLALMAVGGALPAAKAQTVRPRALEFPRDHGAHPEFGIEWWYATGWLQRDAERGAARPAWGFQLTFFRTRTGLAEALPGRFAARQLLFVHAALTDLTARRLVHAERMVRWTGDKPTPRAAAAHDDARVQVADWRLERGADGRYACALGDQGAGFAWRLALAPTQPVLLQGDDGFSRKGPKPENASHYYSQPQLDVGGELAAGAGSRQAVHGRAWLDHEWSGSLMPERAVGWDWIGINLDDGGALMAFRLRDAQGAPVWAGGTLRTRDGTLRRFTPDEVRFDALAWWTSAATRARYVVRWRITCGAGRYELQALVDAQELDGRASTGTVYWEGLSELRNLEGQRLGLGYLEMTGYAAPLRL
ncbi:MAG TPA: lipocalin-like domain-containing protein [Burkholderiaceae bacterium]|nr:lipocalin-like domain-containing protein [Burkholderiaceae bacterium]